MTMTPIVCTCSLDYRRSHGGAHLDDCPIQTWDLGVVPANTLNVGDRLLVEDCSDLNDDHRPTIVEIAEIGLDQVSGDVATVTIDGETVALGEYRGPYEVCWCTGSAEVVLATPKTYLLDPKDYSFSNAPYLGA